MGLFGRKRANCTICNKEITHKHKAKREWYVKSPLCGDCYLDKMKQSYDATITQSCVICKIKSKVTDLWEPRWQWDMEGLLCKKCFDEKESNFKTVKDFCSICGCKLKAFNRFHPKSKWKLKGLLCKNCWDSQKIHEKENRSN